MTDKAPSNYEATVADFRRELEASATTVAQAAREIGRGAGQATLSTWMRGEYAGDVAAVTLRVRRWIETRRAAAEHDTAGAGIDRHVDLDVTLRIQDTLALAQARGEIVVVHGPSGTGKTSAIRNYCENKSAAFYALMSPGVRTITGMLSKVADAIGEGAEHKSGLSAEDTVVKRLADRHALLVSDECQHLQPKLLDELRYLRDASGCGLALVGDQDLKRVVYGAATRRGQIVGRIADRLELKPTLKADVRKLGESVLGRAPSGPEMEILLGAARGDGGMHAMRRLLVRAWDFARNSGRTQIDADDLLLASKGAAP